MSAQQSGESFAELDGERPALIEPGEYELRFDHYETLMLFSGRAPKLVLWFTVISMGPYFDSVKVPRFYNVKRIIGRPARNGRFKVGFRSEFLREFCTLFPVKVPSRLDRFPMSMYENPIIVGRVRTVTTDYVQRDRPGALQYSVIDALVRCL